MRRNRGQRNSRRAHDSLKAANLSVCPKCNSPKLNHKMCSNCGYYKNKVVVDVLAKIANKQKRRKEKAKEAAGK